uniref:Uncharacterized protein n=1 Tax=Oryza nivara TaxID=4536 RepID=A0A0E0HS93_ORYNI
MQHAHKVFDEMCRRVEEWLRGEDELGGSWGLVMAAKRVWGRREMGGGIYRVWEGWLNGRRDGWRTGLEDDMMARGARGRHDGARGSRVAAAPKAPAPDDLRHHSVPLPPSELSQWIPCARELEEAGIRFRPWKGATSFLDVNFSDGGTLEIPELPAIGRLHLVTSPEDMRLLLIISGMLVNQMNGEQDATTGFFGRLCTEAT